MFLESKSVSLQLQWHHTTPHHTTNTFSECKRKYVGLYYEVLFRPISLACLLIYTTASSVAETTTFSPAGPNPKPSSNTTSVTFTPCRSIPNLIRSTNNRRDDYNIERCLGTLGYLPTCTLINRLYIATSKHNPVELVLQL